MARKRWTPKEELTPELLQFREKRKWQIALRRYVLERNKSSFYAPYFGLDSEKFRNWIERQFDADLNWENFSSAWQFDHVVPLAYFDFSAEEDLRLCWNFTNIRIEKLDAAQKQSFRVDLLGAKRYFQLLFEKTGYAPCGEMVKKISAIESSQTEGLASVEAFIQENKSYLDAVAAFDSYEFEQLNSGIALETILAEKEFLKKLGR